MVKWEFDRFLAKHCTLARLDRIMLVGAPIASPDFIQFFRRQFGAAKVIDAPRNLSEILSRGVFALAQTVQVRTEQVVEIKITVSKTPLPPPLPPMPKEARPRLPPIAEKGESSAHDVLPRPDPPPPRPPAPVVPKLSRPTLPSPSPNASENERSPDGIQLTIDRRASGPPSLPPPPPPPPPLPARSSTPRPPIPPPIQRNTKK